MLTYRSASKTACEESGWRLSNLELQKILYLAHMKFMGENDGRPMISSDFEAWKLGPVIPELYHRLKSFGSRSIPDLFLVDRNMRLPEHRVVQSVVRDFADSSPGQLVELTHRQNGAWSRYYEPRENIVIPDAAILREFRRYPF